MTPDVVKRAYAILGLDPSASLRQAKRQYKALVKRWHPDRFARDAAGLAEATERMRLINDAYRAIVHHAAGPVAGVATPPPQEEIRFSRRSSSEQPGRRLTREEIEALVASINGAQTWLPWEPPWLEQSLTKVADQAWFRASRARVLSVVRVLRDTASKVVRRLR